LFLRTHKIKSTSYYSEISAWASDQNAVLIALSNSKGCKKMRRH
jgi:hypothetical protein